MRFLKQSFRWAIVYTLVQLLAVSYVLLDTFVIPRSLTATTASQMTGVIATCGSRYPYDTGGGYNFSIIRYGSGDDQYVLHG